jgi:hypothetical protein
LKTTQVSQECEDVRDLAFVGIIELVGTDVDSNYEAFAVYIVILIRFYVRDLVKVQFLALTELQNVIFEASLLIHYEEICLLSHRRVNLEEELVIDECLDRVVIVIGREIGVNEGKIEDLISEIIIDLLPRLALHPRSDSNRLRVRRGGILTLPELELEVVHAVFVEVPENLIVEVLQAGVVVNAITLHLGLVHVAKTLGAAFCESKILPIFNALTVFNSLPDVLRGHETVRGINWLSQAKGKVKASLLRLEGRVSIRLTDQCCLGYTRGHPIHHVVKSEYGISKHYDDYYP